MRKFPTLLLAPVLPALLAATVLGACGGGGDDTTAPRHGPRSSDHSTSSTRETTSTTATAVAQPEAVAPTAPAPQPSGGACDAAAVYDAIRNSDGVASDLTFEVTYLECADGYGWATIVADYGESATVLLEGSGTDITLLNLGSSVCAADSMPASIATRLAPPGRQDDCPMPAG